MVVVVGGACSTRGWDRACVVASTCVVGGGATIAEVGGGTISTTAIVAASVPASTTGGALATCVGSGGAGGVGAVSVPRIDAMPAIARVTTTPVAAIHPHGGRFVGSDVMYSRPRSTAIGSSHTGVKLL